MVSVICKKAKAKYKYAVRKLLRHQNHLRREVLAEALCSDSSRDFWTEVKRFERWSTRGTSDVIDGTSQQPLHGMWMSIQIRRICAKTYG